jgi:hypothetical protein
MIGSIGDVYVFDLAADVADGVAHGEIPKPFGGEQNVGATDEGVSQSLTAAALEAVFSSEIFDLVGGAAPTGNATEVEGDSDVAEALAEVAALEAVQALTHLIKICYKNQYPPIYFIHHKYSFHHPSRPRPLRGNSSFGGRTAGGFT